MHFLCCLLCKIPNGAQACWIICQEEWIQRWNVQLFVPTFKAISGFLNEFSKNWDQVGELGEAVENFARKKYQIIVSLKPCKILPRKLAKKNVAQKIFILIMNGKQNKTEENVKMLPLKYYFFMATLNFLW